MEHNLITSDESSTFVCFASAPVTFGDRAPIMLPNISNPLAGGFVVATAKDSSRGLFIDDSGLGVFGCGPYLRCFMMYVVVFIGFFGVVRSFVDDPSRFVDDRGFFTPPEATLGVLGVRIATSSPASARASFAVPLFLGVFSSAARAALRLLAGIFFFLFPPAPRFSRLDFFDIARGSAVTRARRCARSFLGTSQSCPARARDAITRG